MNLYKIVTVKYDDYNVSLDSPLQFYQGDSLYLKIEVEIQEL